MAYSRPGAVVKAAWETLAVGQTVAAALTSPVLFVMAPDLDRMQVHANVSEADIGRVHQSQPCTFTVDAHPGREFAGTVVQVRNNPETRQGVVTYTVVIEVDITSRSIDKMPIYAAFGVPEIWRLSGGTLASNSIGRDFYIPGLTPVGGEGTSDPTLDATAQSSRFFFTAETPTEAGTLTGASDPRKDGIALGW